MSREDLRPLTSLRFAAALLVFLWHVPQTDALARTFSFGYTGVAFFFLLSGFILTYTYQRSFDGALTLAAIRSFYVSRIARIYPLLATTTLLMLVILSWVGGSYWIAAAPIVHLYAVVSQLLLLQSWFPVGPIYFGINGPAWSLSVEAFFYALFPFLAWAMFRLFHRASSYHVVAVALLLWSALVAVEFSRYAEPDDWHLYIFPPARLVDFVIGMMLGVAFLRSRPPLRRPLGATSLEVLGVSAVALFIYVSPLVPHALRFAAWLMPASCCLILVFAWQRGAISRVLAHPALVRLGEISFAFYLCHLPVLTLLGHWIERHQPLFMPLAFGSTLGLSFALFHGVEQPLRRRIRERFAGRPRPVGAAETVTSAAVS